MPKTLLITVGALAIILLVGAWAYLFLFGTPENFQETWSNLRSPSTPIEQPITESTNTLPLASSKTLFQLTTRAVAGFTSTALGQPAIRYAEKGTGHIYEINLSNGTEEKIDGTTLAHTVEAYFNREGTEAVLVSVNGPERKVTWRTSLGSENSIDLPATSRDFIWREDGVLLYTDRTPNATIAYQNDGSSSRELWRVPLVDVKVYFTNNQSWLVSKPAAYLSGSLYEIQNGNLSKVAGPGYAFTGLPDPTGQFVLYRYFDTKNKTAVAKIKDLYSGEEAITPLSAVPEKCVFNQIKSQVWCASSFMFLSPEREYLNQWYRGETTSADKLVVSDYGTWDTANIKVDLSTEAGFDVDVADLAVSSDGTFLLFRNKLNDTLWMYRINEPPPNLEDLPAEETTDASVEQTPEQ